MKSGAKTSVVSVLREQEKHRQLKFWRLLLQEDADVEPRCPTQAEPPHEAVYFGLMPRALRGAFAKTVMLHERGHATEAQILDNAVSDLLQEHFREQLEWKRQHGHAPIAEFRVVRDWHVYAIPFPDWKGSTSHSIIF